MSGETAQSETARGDTRAQIYLQPIAAPSILGFYGLAGTFMVAAHMAHWFGSSTTPLYLFPFAAIFGGLAQFLAGMWRTRRGTVSPLRSTECGAHSGWHTAS